MKYVAVFASVFIASTAVAAETQDTIPEQFQGTWAASDSACDLGTLADSTLTIDETQLTFYESDARVVSVTVEDETELSLTLEMSGEGETWLTTAQFQLSGNEQELTDVTNSDYAFTRVRCSY